MMLEIIQTRIAQLIENYPLKNLKSAYEQVSNTYRKERHQIENTLLCEEDVIAYLAARCPATYRVISQILATIPLENVSSVLDIGAGSGVASWAILAQAPQVPPHFFLLEKNPIAVKFGQMIFAHLADHYPLEKKHAHWMTGNYTSTDWEIFLQGQPKSFDLAVASYAFNEIPSALLVPTFERFWQRTNQTFLIAEPGTQEGFDVIHSLREYAIQKGIHTEAPCTHTNTCPAYNAKDVCHFATRIPRSRAHKFLKEGSRGFEDEKYAYLVLSKQPSSLVQKRRIVRKPHVGAGYVQFKTCSEPGFEDVVFSRKDGGIYKKAKKWGWGGVF